MFQKLQENESNRKFIVFTTNTQEDESLHKEENNDIAKESNDEEESKNIHINDNDSSQRYLVISKQILMARLCNKFEKELTEEYLQELNVAFLPHKFSTLQIKLKIFLVSR